MMIHYIKFLQKINLALRLDLLEILIDWQTFSPALSLAIDRLTVAMEGGGHD